MSIRSCSSWQCAGRKKWFFLVESYALSFILCSLYCFFYWCSILPSWYRWQWQHTADFFSNHVPLLNSKKYFMQLPVEFLIKSCCNAGCSCTCVLRSPSTPALHHCITQLLYLQVTVWNCEVFEINVLHFYSMLYTAWPTVISESLC